MQLSNGPALLHALTPRTYVVVRRFLRQAKLRWASWRPRQRLAEDIGADPVRSTEKLRFADTDCNGHGSNVGLAVCCQNARIDATTRRAIQFPPVLIDALYEIGQHGLHNRFSVNFRLGNAIKGILVRL
jgi:hypothetical protein